MSNTALSRLTRTAAILAAVALAAAGCAATPAPSATTPPPAQSTDLSDRGREAAEAAGPAVALEPRSIGFIRYLASDPSDQMLFEATEQAAELLGWEIDVCDGQGTPAVIAQCASVILSHGPDAILSDGIPQAYLVDAIAQASAQDVPWITIFATNEPSDLFTAAYTDPDDDMGRELADYFVEKLEPVGGAEMIEQKFDGAPWGVARQAPLDEALSGTDITVVADPQADPMNLVQGTQTQVAALLAQYPDTKGIWITWTSAAPGAVQAVQARHAGQSFPDRPLIGTFLGIPQNFELLRTKQLDAVSTDNFTWSGWVALDQLAEYFARGTEISTENRPDYGEDLDFWRPTIYTPDNVPASSAGLPMPVDFVSFFTAKWDAEFE